MTFEEMLDHALAMLQRRGRLTYHTLQRQFHLDDDALNDLKEALLYAHPEQELRGCSYLLQGWQCELSALEDEAPLELPPGASLVKTFTFHQHIRHQT